MMMTRFSAAGVALALLLLLLPGRAGAEATGEPGRDSKKPNPLKN